MENENNIVDPRTEAEEKVVLYHCPVHGEVDRNDAICIKVSEEDHHTYFCLICLRDFLLEQIGQLEKVDERSPAN